MDILKSQSKLFTVPIYPNALITTFKIMSERLRVRVGKVFITAPFVSHIFSGASVHKTIIYKCKLKSNLLKMQKFKNIGNTLIEPKINESKNESSIVGSHV